MATESGLRMISIICPTFGRPAKCRRMIDTAHATAHGDIQILLGVGGEDNSQHNAENHWGYDITGASAMHFRLCPTVFVVNYLAMKTKSDLIMVVGDDAIFTTPHWDKALIEHYQQLKNKIHVYSLRDSRDENGTPHPIVTKEYLGAMGYLFTPIFLHWYADTWLTETAKHNNIFTHLKDYMLVHDKSSDAGQADITHTRIRDFGWQNRDKTVNDSCLHILELEKKRLEFTLREKEAA